MKATDLLVSNLNITEDEYSYKGIFTLSGGGVSISVDLAELDEGVTLQEIKEKFSLMETKEEIRKNVMDKVMIQASVSAEIKEGEDFQGSKGKEKSEDPAGYLDRA